MATDTTPATDAVAPPATAVTAANGQRAMWLLLGAAFVAILNETTMSIAIPHLVTDLDITTNAAQWITTSFMLTMAVVIPISGFLLQRFTTRTMFIAAMALFSLGTLIALVAPGFPVLVVARVVQASGTAVMMPLLMTTIMTVVPPQQRGRMMGRVSVVISLAPAIGPTLSGLLLDSVGWRGIFAVILPIALIALAVGAVWIRNLGERTDAPIDVLSIILSAFGFGGLVYGLSQIGGAEGGDRSGTLAVMIVSLSVGAVALALFVWRQLVLQRRDGALLDLRVFGSRNFTLSIVQMTLLSAAFFGAITLLPIYLQNVRGLESTATGLIVLPGALAMGLSGPIVGRIYDRWGTAVLLVPGAIAVEAVLWLFTTFDASTPIWLIVGSYILLSLALSLSFTPLFTASLGSLTPKFYSYGSAVLSTAQQVAGAAGIAVIITTMTAASAAAGSGDVAATAPGTHAAFLVAALIAAPTLLGAFLVRKPADDLAETPIGH